VEIFLIFHSRLLIVIIWFHGVDLVCFEWKKRVFFESLFFFIYPVLFVVLNNVFYMLKDTLRISSIFFLTYTD